MSTATVTARQHSLASVVRDYIALTKPRIIVLLDLTTFCAMIIAAHGWPGTGLVVLTLLGGWLAASGANTINCWFDRDIDLVMGRTRSRPLPSGRIRPAHALIFGLVLGASAFVLLATWVNLISAVLAMTGLAFYVLVYTMYLKRNTIQNIVVGGAAGAIPPMVGFTAVTGHIELTAIFLFAIIFYWTPPHFWALALLLRSDYSKADVPMLPSVSSERFTHVNIVLYSVVLAAVSMLPFVTREFGFIYLGGAVMLNALFIGGGVRMLLRPSARAARRLYYYSLLYLALIFAVMAVDSIIRLG